MPGNFGLQGLRPIVSLQNVVGPVEQVRIRVPEFFPGVFTHAFHPFVNQQEVRPGNRLVVEVGLAVSGGEVFQTVAEPLERIQDRILSQVQPDGPDVIPMLKISRGQGACFELSNELDVVHLFMAAPCRACIRSAHLLLFFLGLTPAATRSTFFSTSR